jgi:hypothetical protein
MRLCTASTGSDCSVVASSVGRIGSPAGRIEIEVMHTGKELLEVDPAHSDRLNVHLPLRDASGKTIGVVTLVHPYKAAGDKPTLSASSTRIRDELGAQVSTMAALLVLDP